MLPGWGKGTPKVGSIKGDPIVIGPKKNPQGTDMVIKSSGIRGGRHLGDVILGLVPWALDSSNVAQEIPSKQCINRGSKARICSI